MKVLPFLEDIYDYETEQLESLLSQLQTAVTYDLDELPQGVESMEKFRKKARKLIDSIELELTERSQVDNMISFFTESSNKYLSDDFFDIAPAQRTDTDDSVRSSKLTESTLSHQL